MQPQLPEGVPGNGLRREGSDQVTQTAHGRGLHTDEQ